MEFHGISDFCGIATPLQASGDRFYQQTCNLNLILAFSGTAGVFFRRLGKETGQTPRVLLTHFGKRELVSGLMPAANPATLHR